MLKSAGFIFRVLIVRFYYDNLSYLMLLLLLILKVNYMISIKINA